MAGTEPELAIEIDGISVFARHGVLPAERARGQRFLIDVRAEPASPRACATDDLGDAVDYGALAGAVARVAAGEPCDLLEHLADRIARELLAGFPLRAVTVRVSKPDAPIAVTFANVAVSVTRRS